MSINIRIWFKLLILIVLSSSVLCIGPSCTRSSEKKTISISGAFALYPLTVKWAEEYQKLNPGIIINVSAGGAGKGITDVLSGMVDLAMLSRNISPEESKKGAWHVTVARDAVVPTMNTKNPFAEKIIKGGLMREEFKDIYISKKTTTWEQLIHEQGKNSINLFTRSDACGAGDIWAKYLGSDQESLAGIGVFGDPGMADAVSTDKFGMGYNNVVYAFDLHTRKPYPGIMIIPIDINGNGEIDRNEIFYSTLDSLMQAIGDGRYPSPPARDLYLISKGKPQNETAINFLQWILTDGQKYVKEAGYIQLSASALENEKAKLKK